MDQIKIGRFISERRRAAGLTQAKLGERLGVTDKAVSKWERGICLPDVSLYMELCDVLGISINELFAGEQVRPEDHVRKSEETIVSIVEDGRMRQKRLHRTIALLSAIVVVLTVISVWAGIVLIRSGAFQRNYFRPYAMTKANQEIMTAIAGTGDPHLFEFSVDARTFHSVTVYRTVIRNGVRTEEQPITGEDWSALLPDENTGREKAEGNGLVSVVMSDGGYGYRLTLLGGYGGGMVDVEEELDSGIPDGHERNMSWEALDASQKIRAGERVVFLTYHIWDGQKDAAQSADDGVSYVFSFECN